jgi:deaminated glutathione amidase
VDSAALEEALRSVQALCAELKMGAAIGCNHKHAELDRPLNSLYVIDAAGQIEARYDKRFCSNSEINDWYAAGSAPVVVDVKGIKLGFALCIEVNFPELFMEYERLGVDCVGLSSYSEGEMFAIQAQGHAACNNFWVSYSVPANVSHTQPSQLIGPDGSVVGTCDKGVTSVIVHEINPADSKWAIPCHKARPWRRTARKGEIYTAHKIAAPGRDPPCPI